jgi:aldehyde dehydrogenase (NAD+)
MASHPDVDLVSFTGSTRAGVLVAQAAAPTVKRRGAGARRQVAQRVPARCRFRQRGAQGRARHDAQRRPVVRLADADGGAGRSLRRSRGARGRRGQRDRRRRPLDEATVLGPLANAPQFAKVQELIQSGHRPGSQAGLRRAGPAAGAQSRVFRPADDLLRGDPGDAHRAGGDLRPGPGADALHDEDDAVRIANATVYGLSSHVQSADLESARRVAADSARDKCISTIRRGRAMRRSAATGSRATGASTGLRPRRVSRGQSHPRILVSWFHPIGRAPPGNVALRYAEVACW